MEEYIFEEMSEDELIDSVEEFLPLVDQPKRSWLDLSPLQKDFRRRLDPSHFDLFTCQSAPCEAYLKSARSSA